RAEIGAVGKGKKACRKTARGPRGRSGRRSSNTGGGEWPRRHRLRCGSDVASGDDLRFGGVGEFHAALHTRACFSCVIGMAAGASHGGTWGHLLIIQVWATRRGGDTASGRVGDAATRRRGDTANWRRRGEGATWRRG